MLHLAVHIVTTGRLMENFCDLHRQYTRLALFLLLVTTPVPTLFLSNVNNLPPAETSRDISAICTYSRNLLTLRHRNTLRITALAQDGFSCSPSVARRHRRHHRRSAVVDRTVTFVRVVLCGVLLPVCAVRDCMCVMSHTTAGLAFLLLLFSSAVTVDV